MYKRLMSGSSNTYYMDILKELYQDVEFRGFRWNEIILKNPKINKSVLSRLKVSGFIQKRDYIIINNRRYLTWMLNPEVKEMLIKKNFI